MDYNQQFPNLDYEKKHWEKSVYVIGVDEVGRGPLAGPVHVGAVCLPILHRESEIKLWEEMGINDSKQLSSRVRLTLSEIIKQKALCYSVASSTVSEINTQGIVNSIHRAVRKAVRDIITNLGTDKQYFVLLDAITIKYLRDIGKQNQLGIIKGDCKSISIAGASIIAKVVRDNYMSRLSSKYGAYGWEKNKGYGTKVHREAILKFGLTKHHRTLFVRKVLSQGSNNEQ